MNSLRRFRSQCKGSVALLFAIAVVPIVVGAGLAIDYARALARRSTLQNRLDGAVIAVAREAAALNDASIRTKIEARLAHSDPDSTLKHVDVARTTSPPELTARASATVETSLMKLIGIKEVNIEVKTTATWDTADVVLVLDTSDGMSAGTRMADLKTAVNHFISRVGANDNLVQIALVPYAVGVRVPVTTTYKDADWILFTGDYIDGEDGEDGEDGTSISTSTWTGCLTDRKMNYDTDDTFYNYTDSKKYPARPTCRSGETGLSTIIRLTSGQANFNAMMTHVNGITAGGGTNMTIGVAWGHAMLSKSIVPFTEARAPAVNHRRIIIMVSSHANTKSRWFDAAAGGLTYLNQRTAASCTAAKAAGVEIYTLDMSYSSTNDALLSGCATDAGHFANPASGTDAKKAFDEFANTVRAPRLTH